MVTETREPGVGVPAMAVISGAFLSGAMTSLSACAIPVLVGTNLSDADHITRQWAVLYRYGRTYMPPLCIVTCGLYGFAVLANKRKASRRYVLAIASTIAMLPFTWIAMAPTNNTLFRLDEEDVVELSLVRSLVVRWAWMHVARSLFPLLGAFLGFTGLLQALIGPTGEWNCPEMK